MNEILILKSQDVCHGILDVFAENLKNVFINVGLNVECFDIKKEPAQEIVKYYNKEFLAVIDFYSGLLPTKINDNDYFWDGVNSQIYQFCFDVPMYIESVLGCKLKRYHALCMDRNYIKIFEDYYNIKGRAIHLPIPGKQNSYITPWNERKYDVVFIGAYTDYREVLNIIGNCNNEIQILAKKYFDMLINNPNTDILELLNSTLEALNSEYEKNDIYSTFLSIGKVARAASGYLREKMIEALINEGIKVDVFGDSWENYNNSNNNLIKHRGVGEEEYIEILSNAKISLCIMYPNKSGFSERCSYSMLNGAALLTDKTDYLNEECKDEVFFYDLANMKHLASQVREILSGSNTIDVTRKATEKALKNYSWEVCTKRILEYILETTNEM